MTLTWSGASGKVPGLTRASCDRGFELASGSGQKPLSFGRHISRSFLTSLAMLLTFASTSSRAEEAAGAPSLDWEPPVESRLWKSIVLHHSATARGDVASIDAAHRRRTDAAGKPWLGIGYHFVIGNGQGLADGAVEPTFRWREQLAGAHAGSREQNDRGIGICLIGDFSQTSPTMRQLAATRRLIAALADRYQIPKTDILRHSDIRTTQCPGRLFPWSEALAEVAESAEPTSSASSRRTAR